MKYVSKKEQINYLAGLSGQNLVYSLIGGSFFTYFMTDIAMFPAAIVSVILILMKVWDGINDPIVGSFVDRHSFKNGEKFVIENSTGYDIEYLESNFKKQNGYKRSVELSKENNIYRQNYCGCEFALKIQQVLYYLLKQK